MDDNTLLKVLEQLLHKIKANRRREMVELTRTGDGTDGFISTIFVIAYLGCKFRSKATDRAQRRKPPKLQH